MSVPRGFVVAFTNGKQVQLFFARDVDTREAAVEDVLYDTTPRQRETITEIRVVDWDQIPVLGRER